MGYVSLTYARRLIMGKMGFKVEYLYHSGYTVETDKYFLVFEIGRAHV